MPAGKSAALTRAQWWECRIKSQHSYLLLWKTFFAVPFGCYWSGFPPSESAVAFSVSISLERISRITCTLRNNNHARQAYCLFHDLGLLKLPWNDGPSCMGTKKLSNWRLNAEFEKEIFDCDQCNFRDRFAAWWNDCLMCHRLTNNLKA